MAPYPVREPRIMDQHGARLKGGSSPVSSMLNKAAGFATGASALAVVDEKDIKTTLSPPLMSMLTLRTEVECSKCDAFIWCTSIQNVYKNPKAAARHASHQLSHLDC
jgi:hypothetical protein